MVLYRFEIRVGAPISDTELDWEVSDQRVQKKKKKKKKKVRICSCAIQSQLALYGGRSCRDPCVLTFWSYGLRETYQSVADSKQLRPRRSRWTPITCPCNSQYVVSFVKGASNSQAQ